MRKSSVVYINVNAIFIKTVLIICLFLLIYAYWKWNLVERIQVSSGDLRAEVIIENQTEIKQVLEGLKHSNMAMQSKPLEGTYVLKLISRRKTKIYTFDNLKIIYDNEQENYLVPTLTLQNYLQKVQGRLVQLSPFGRLQPWEEVDQIFQVNNQILIRDLDTGKKFQVTRIGGLRHADIEPLTTKDSQTIKSIYDERWSWKRRAVIVYIDGKKIAASMNGMPHDEDNNKRNGIKGHFCLYFYGSNHPKDKLNLAHEMMVWKAAGKIKEKFRNITPENTIQLLFTAIDQGDYSTVGLISVDSAATAELARKNLISCTIRKVEAQKDLQYQVTAKVSYLNGPYEIIKKLPVKLRYNSSRKIYYLDAGLIKNL